jgi:hypothetical protein
MMSEFKIIDELYNNNAVKYSYHQSDKPKTKKSKNDDINYKSKKLKINSISELEFLYNDSQNRTSTKNKNMKIKKKNIINYTSNDKNSTDIMSPKYDINNKYSRQQKPPKSKKSTHSSFDMYWEAIKNNEKTKENKINNLKTESIKQQISEMRNYPKISKRSIMLANAKERDALFLKRPFSEEKYLDEDFLTFYKRNLDSINKDKGISTNEKRVREKFNKFYEDNIKWKKNKDEVNEKIRHDNIKKQDNYMKGILTFRPLLSENTIKIVQKMKKNKKLNMNQYNNLYNYENERELLDKLKLKLKPVLSEYFDINNTRRPYISKKSLYLANNLSDNNRRKDLYRTRSYQIITDKNKIIRKDRTENKLLRKGRKEENKDETISDIKFERYKGDKAAYKKNKYQHYLLKKFKEMKKPKANQKKELYKLNIRQESAWNKEFVNNIIPKRKCNYIIEGLL